MSDRPSYEEITPWPAWVAWLVAGSVTAALVATWQSDPAEGLVVMAVAVPIMALSAFLLGRLRVRVTRDAVVVGFGYSEVIRKRVRYEDIQSIEPVRYSPLREFGGWGIKRGFGGKRAWTIRGNQALVLHLKDGKRIYVGSDNPARLAERVRSAAAGLLDAPGPDLKLQNL